MGDKSKIEWTDATWNPVRGCSVVSEGCRNCYAMSIAARFSGEHMPYEGLAYRNDSGAHWTGKVRLIEKHLEDPLKWRKPARVFVNSMSDLFHEELSFGQIFSVFLVMQGAPQHTFQVLTKRPARMKEFIEWMQIWGEATALAMNVPEYYEWPYPNTWLGVSVEDQKTADERIPLLMDTPAAVRWISAEPLLGLIDLESVPTLEGSIDWVVVGGESGPGARPMHPDWARSLRDQCVAASVPFFFKQWGEWKEFGHDEDGPEIEEVERGTEMCEATAPLCDGFLSLTGHFVKNLKDVQPDVHYRGLERMGKKAAGRTLDGRTWDGFPTAKAVTA